MAGVRSSAGAERETTFETVREEVETLVAGLVSSEHPVIVQVRSGEFGEETGEETAAPPIEALGATVTFLYLGRRLRFYVVPVL
ncbi:hypothetical protein Nepgr_024108 [Nepenthes gracilis]|uniref:Uncharacterized protein n=1 Tax=Nepenthes gracilis TaxID=150966 RepID=A0AAD3T2J2_NEPGR|nr:hypothetical protein Nepgr_024108 [Nepenthes gracilis]